MDELIEQVRQALAAEYPGAPNGRVRDVPDRRAIRWYTSTGLVDRPLGSRGRTALYGPRHLLQLVAIKRLQAQGHALAWIQAELRSADDEALNRVAQVPADLIGDAVAAGEGALAAARAPARFWTRPPGGTTVSAPRPATTESAVRPLSGLALAPGVLLILPQPVPAGDLGAVAEAAAPLLHLLAARGLIDGSL
jgi:DNA-binding transcriptional MerR regulator